MKRIVKSDFGTVGNNTVDLYTVTFENQLEIKISNYGGIITSLSVPDRDGKMKDIVLGYDSIEEYLEESPYFGAIVGRYGNRIAKGQFTIDGQRYDLARNDGENHLHGGLKGFDKAVWDVVDVFESAESASIVLQTVSANLEEGYPGNLVTIVTYTICSNELTVEYSASTNKATVVNLTQHSYFNLSGNLSDSILDHHLQIDSESFLPVDDNMIPTGEIRSVRNTPFDFRESKKIADDIETPDPQLIIGGGYDHCWVLLTNPLQQLRKVATVSHPLSGCRMKVLTTEPGIQFYSGNFLAGDIVGKKNSVYGHRCGLCLETQHFPDSPNQPKFPSTLLKPGEQFNSKTVFQFSVN